MEITSPVVAPTSFRTLVAIATERNIEFKLDVDSFFLYRDLSKEIYLKQSKGFQIKRANGKKLACKLQKAIYKLKRADWVWWKLIDLELKDLDFTNCTKDVCVYT